MPPNKPRLADGPGGLARARLIASRSPSITPLVRCTMSLVAGVGHSRAAHEAEIRHVKELAAVRAPRRAGLVG